MKIAIPIYNDSVSNVFDFATRLLLVDIENGKEANRSEVALESQSLSQRTGQIKNLEIDVLVCGAISRVLANMVTTSGIQVLPYVTGQVDDVLQAYLTGRNRSLVCRVAGRVREKALVVGSEVVDGETDDAKK